MARVQLQEVRLSFPDLFIPTEFEKGDGKARFNAAFLTVPGTENDKRIWAAIQQVAIEAWGQKDPAKGLAKVREYEGNSNKFCYIDGNKKDYDGYKSMFCLSSHRKAADGRPSVLDRNKAPLTLADGKPYAGCYVNALVEIWAQDGTNSGIRCGLLGVQFVKDGDAFSGAGRASAEDFEDLGVPADADDLM